MSKNFNFDLGSCAARLQHDPACMSTKEIQSLYHVIEPNEVRGRCVRQGSCPNGAAGLALIGAAAGSERAGSDRGSGPRVGLIGAAAGSDRVRPIAF